MTQDNEEPSAASAGSVSVEDKNMTCPICDQKPMNCDCTPRERAMWQELQELDGRPSIIIADAERQAIKEAMDGYEAWMEDNVCWHKPEVQAVLYHLRGLLGRTK